MGVSSRLSSDPILDRRFLSLATCVVKGYLTLAWQFIKCLIWLKTRALSRNNIFILNIEIEFTFARDIVRATVGFM